MCIRDRQAGVHLQHFESIPALATGAILKEIRLLFTDQKLPYWIPPGGTSALGVLGYVNAAFELQAQIEAGDLAAPDVIYIACGTMGSSVGLALGLALLGSQTRVCAVAVTDTNFSSMKKAKKLYAQSGELLRKAGADMPVTGLREDSFELRSDFFGGEYGCYTEAGMQAVNRFQEATGLQIEGCYTGKCLAALSQDLKSGRLDGQQVLFWNTYDGQSQDHPVDELDYRLLPESLHTYFESEVQPLDRK